MENQDSIVNKLEEVIRETEKDIIKGDASALLNKANDFYNKLIDEGVIKKRGYTLRGIEDAHLFQNKLVKNYYQK